MSDYLQISSARINEEIRRCSEKIREYSENGLNPDEILYNMYIARRDAFIWVSRIGE